MLAQVLARGIGKTSFSVGFAASRTPPVLLRSSLTFPFRQPTLRFPGCLQTVRTKSVAALSPGEAAATTISTDLGTLRSKVAQVLFASDGALVKPGYERAVGWWLAGTSGMILSMIALGGYTRLSGSGLSMTDWRIQGRRLPFTEEAWLREFEEYKRYPEYQRLHNGSMELEDFKRIYFVEWFHRMWGRTTGAIFAAPLIYFAARRAFRAPLAVRLSGLLALGLSQAFVGWWMVRSGFDPPEKHNSAQGQNQRPRVSAYRLASHFTAALTLYVGCVWTSLTLLRPSPAAIHGSCHEAVAAARKLRLTALPAAFLVTLTLLSGPFVAGNDAGRAYNTWPKMIDDWVPPEWIAAASSPLKAWRSFFEDTAVVQFDHRCLAYASVLSSLAVYAYSAVLPISMPAVAAVRLLPMVVAAQMCLGIATLLLYVPIELGVAHQFGGVAVLTTLLFVMHTLRIPVIPM